jgi:hypothetical protein
MSKEDKSVVLAFVASLATVKLVTSIMIVYFFPSWHTVMLTVALSLVWFVPPIIYLADRSPGRYRLIRGRMRRQELLRQEWEVEESTPSRR